MENFKRVILILARGNQSMFRKARDEDQKRAVGRPPTPPGTPAKTPFTLSVPPQVPVPVMAIKTRSKQTPLPTIGRQGPTGRSKPITPAKPRGKPNSSILSFFKKAEDSLFVVGETVRDEEEEVEKEETRFNESENSTKKRKFDESRSTAEPPPKPAEKKIGPFVEESDSEDDEQEQPEAVIPTGLRLEEDFVQAEGDVHAEKPLDQPVTHPLEQSLAILPEQSLANPLDQSPPNPPQLIKQETSYAGDPDEFAGIEDFDEDLFEQGDEFMERRYMEEQTKLEEEQDDIAPGCPICGINLTGLDEQQVGVHVNHCLDGQPIPLPERKISPSPPPEIKSEHAASASHYRRPFRPPRPGQANPFTLGQEASGGSAFNKLMSGHAEDAAWAEAAASEHASRGKPSYQRTCPFYKILPGLFICVDAFRYGAVAGCQAYFLSHFHSDHYVGLTSTWCHGPIYCSHITANLVRQQLRVDPQYVIDLDFDQTIVVPGTQGVKVTMISANHCPGSSLYLFEKVVGKKSNSEPRLQRILHCGDFRACKAHIEHPLLMPDVCDKVSGKTKEQKIDVCYLDTTYLNPKYAFPPQDQVIKACADMCVSLSRCTPDQTDGWETMKRQRAGEGMVKFIRRESTNPEAMDDETKDDLKIEKNPHAAQQILSSASGEKTRGRLLVIVGTYSIGKERICVGIAHALGSKIYAPTGKQRIVAALEDSELNALMTTDPREAQVHMTPLFEIRAETLDDYLKDFFPHFTRAVGFRPSGWNYRPPNSRFLDSPPVSTVLNGDNWRSFYSMKDLVPQRGSTSRSSCFGVPYSEHSSFRELTMFCCSLRIERIIPTVNVGSAKGRERMKAWADRWGLERRKVGVWKGEW